jgi:predicted component of type VI protein secretion system
MHPWSDPHDAALSFFRIRLQHEEIALPIGVTLIGRDPACRISIFDSMISRRHARIQCDLEHAAIDDMGSRNGTRVNGVRISGLHVLRDGDRIQIGTQELVMGISDSFATDEGPPTGAFALCATCKVAFPDEHAACPRCGTAVVRAPASRSRLEDSSTTRDRWSLGMLIEMIGKAILSERAADAERIMREAANIVNERMRETKMLDPEEVHGLAEAAKWMAKTQKNESWLEWMAQIKAQMIEPKH